MDDESDKNYGHNQLSQYRHLAFQHNSWCVPINACLKFTIHGDRYLGNNSIIHYSLDGVVYQSQQFSFDNATRTRSTISWMGPSCHVQSVCRDPTNAKSLSLFDVEFRTVEYLSGVDNRKNTAFLYKNDLQLHLQDTLRNFYFPELATNTTYRHRQCIPNDECILFETNPINYRLYLDFLVLRKNGVKLPERSSIFLGTDPDCWSRERSVQNVAPSFRQIALWREKLPGVSPIASPFSPLLALSSGILLFGIVGMLFVANRQVRLLSRRLVLL